jgi:hypothetical protein
VAWLPSDTATTFGRTLVAGRWLAPEWEHLCRSVGKVEWIPEFQGLDEPKRSLGQFDMLSALWLGTHGHEAVGYFDLSNGGANELALRLHRDPGLQLRVARALGIPDQDLTRVGPAALRRAHGFRGGLTDMGAAANLLETGER